MTAPMYHEMIDDLLKRQWGAISVDLQNQLREIPQSEWPHLILLRTDPVVEVTRTDQNGAKVLVEEVCRLVVPISDDQYRRYLDACAIMGVESATPSYWWITPAFDWSLPDD